MSQHVVHEAVRPRARVSTRSVVSPHALPRRPRVPARGRFSLPMRRVPLRPSLRRRRRCAVPLAAPSRLTAPPPRRSPRCAPRCAVPLAAPPPRSPHRVRCTARRLAHYRGAFAHPTRWHSVSARSEPAQRAITPRQRSRHAITPRQWNRCAITPQQRRRHAITPQQRSRHAETPQQRHHGPPTDAYKPLAKRASQEMRPDLDC